MTNHCDIYKVTLITRYSETGTGGLHEQEIDRGIFQSDICEVSEGFKENKAAYFKRVLFQYWIQPEVCYPEIKWTHPVKNQHRTPAPEETHLRGRGSIDFGCSMGGSGLSLFNKTKGIDKTLAAVDTEAISAHSAGRETAAFDQRPSDRQKAQRQESSNWQTYLWPHQTGDSAEASYPYKNRQLGRKDARMDGNRYSIAFRELCRREICLYDQSNGYSYYVGREPSSAG